MSLKLLADSYVELNIKAIKEITGENYSLYPETKSENYIKISSYYDTMLFDFSIVDKNSKWSDFADVANISNIEAVKTYIYLKVRLIFDPPTSGIVMDSISSTIKELECRLNTQYEINM